MKRIKILVSVLLLAATTVSCGDFLSETPDNRTVIDSPRKVEQLLVAAYPDATFMLFNEMMADDVRDSGKMNLTSENDEKMFTFQDVHDEDLDWPIRYWMEAYKAIAQANTALEAIDKLEKEYANKPSKRSLENLRGEALLARAYSHFMLVNLWAKHYDPATASSDMGIPYMTSVEDELLVKYERNSVEEVYDLIEDDILTGIAKLKGVTYENNNVERYHFNEAAANAFATRFYLFKGDYKNAIKYSQAVQGLPIGKLRDVQGANKKSIEQNETDYAQTYVPTNLLVSTVKSRMTRILHTNRFNLSSASANRSLFGPNTHPLAEKNGNWNYPNDTYSLNDRYYVHKFYEHFKIIDFTNMTGHTYVSFVLFSNDMMYLDRIEAMILDNQIDEASKMLEYFTLTRTNLNAPAQEFMGSIKYSDWQNLYPIQTSDINPKTQLSEEQTTLLRALLDARRREGYQEGYRWFDIRRYNIVVKHQMATGEVYEVKENDNLQQLQIPLMAIDKGITPNPR
ncbi:MULTISPECIES: RagB/SusD family nutrient uptake outer membrane protein [Myroides]|uniref:RagB/SusD family nutrient uptake outer membrane protein n=1 Tax=Myroides albus TaxID=2562892 RepID=A0A6I3LLS8_9FLAO|nr:MULTISPECIES: RagB/SusD family nutrient uptake outer membrane protein [Myroides]MTG98647.1 RagB/SusD family nutrient uptake outer membrane protein [Myroides albus]MVX37065.1 RagB/SusD family nutrient uptake outer membrane protein [Myroides sp. LoEW2-1]UVD79210.1 RagB/SusD family nutrient uptake outer membrane protein [Myroides albus]